MKILWSTACAVLVIGLAAAAPAQTFNTLFYFDGQNGSSPLAVPVQGRDGNFYGTTEQGGAGGGRYGGTVFEITPGGVLTTLYSFCFPNSCHTGKEPAAGLILGTDGNLYGTTNGGGGPGYDGEVFRITSTGSLAEVPLNGTDGMWPRSPVVQGIDGNLYGTTPNGGSNSAGVVFKASPPGVLTVLYNFCSQPNCTDGSGPEVGMVQASDGNFYGTTYAGGAYCSLQGTCGTVFKITPKGALTTLHTFCSQPNCTDGALPEGPLVQAIDGNLYGTTGVGGAQGYGTVFRIDSKGTLTTLYSFCSLPNCVDGSAPSGLVQATDGNFYGTTASGGNQVCDGTLKVYCGTIFELTPTGTLTTVHTFDGTDGWAPVGLMQATSGPFYGTTLWSDVGCYPYGCGTVYSLSMGLAPFVAFVQRAGKIGQTAQVLGQGFTGTTSVSFNGISAKFTVQSDTYLTAKVPAGATTGYITVTEPSGVLKSNVPFQVIR